MKKIFFVIWTSLMFGFVQSVAQNTLYDSVWEKATNGDARSQSKGDRYYWGQKEIGIQQDYKKAAEWYLLAANQGYSHVQYMLGKMFENGQGVEKDIDAAFKWYSNDVSQEDEYQAWPSPTAMRYMSYCYQYGLGGVSKDNSKASYWMTKAKECKYQTTIDIIRH